jgi:hypothetical protein
MELTSEETGDRALGEHREKKRNQPHMVPIRPKLSRSRLNFNALSYG